MPSPQLMIAMGAAMPIVDSLFVSLRLYAKHGKARYGLDDHFILLALVTTLSLPRISFTKCDR